MPLRCSLREHPTNGECDARGRLGLEAQPYPQRPFLLRTLHAVQAVVTRDIAAHAAEKGLSGPKIGALIHEARIAAVAAAHPGMEVVDMPHCQSSL